MPAIKQSVTVRLDEPHRFVLQVVAQAEDVQQSEAIRRIIERYARQIVELPDGAEEVYTPEELARYPSLWQEARAAAREGKTIGATWVGVHGDRAA